MSIKLCHLMDQLRPKTGNHLEMFVLYILLILCISNVSNKLYHRPGGYQLSAQYKRSTGESCLGKKIPAHVAAMD